MTGDPGGHRTGHWREVCDRIQPYLIYSWHVTVKRDIGLGFEDDQERMVALAPDISHSVWVVGCGVVSISMYYTRRVQYMIQKAGKVGRAQFFIIHISIRAMMFL